jgi:hypothetical protein
VYFEVKSFAAKTFRIWQMSNGQSNIIGYQRAQLRQSLGDNIAIAFFCKHCDKREWAFLSHREYDTHKGVIDNAIQTNESTFANRVS